MDDRLAERSSSVGSPLLGRLGPGEQRALMEHESRHYSTTRPLTTPRSRSMLPSGEAHPFARDSGGGGCARLLLEWSRRRVSCDGRRRWWFANRRSLTGLMASPADMHADHLNFDGSSRRRAEHEAWDDPSDPRSPVYYMRSTPPTRTAVRSVSEVMRWVQSGESTESAGRINPPR